MEPTRLGPYTIRGRLGRGGMGTVYEAVDAEGRTVAVKTLSRQIGDDPGMRRRFEAEIEALKGLRHPGIVRLLAFGEEEGQPFFAMELVGGRSLEDFLQSGRRFTWQEAVATALAVTGSLKAAHDQGIVHRDLKPANLLLVDGPGAGVRLADFGIARLFGDEGQTRIGTVVGTAEYMAPEQAAGDPVDHRADLYALGLVMYAMLVGRPPFTGGDVTEVIRRQRRETPPRVSAIVPEVPAAVDKLIEKLLAKDPNDRPASALAVGRMLKAIAAEPEPPQSAGDATATLPGGGEGGTRAGTAAASAGTGGIDFLADTRAIPAVAGSQGGKGRGITVEFGPALGTAGGLAHRATEPSPAAGVATAPGGSSFTTVEEMHRTAREQSRRTAWRDGLVRFIAAALILGAVGVVGYVVLRPPTADELHARIKTIAEDSSADLGDARELIDAFLSRHGEDARADEIRVLARRLDVDALERRSRLRPRDDLAPIERDYRAAMAREEESPLACLAALEAILALHADDGPAAADIGLWLDLVRRQIDRVAPRAAKEREQDVTLARRKLDEAAALATQAATAEGEQRDGLLARRRDLLEGIVAIYADRPHVADAAAEAARLLERENDADPPGGEPPP